MKGWLGLNGDINWVLVIFGGIGAFLFSASGRALLVPPTSPAETVWGVHLVWLSSACALVVLFALFNLFQMNHGKGKS